MMTLGESASYMERNNGFVGGDTKSHPSLTQTMDSINEKLDWCMTMVAKMTSHDNGGNFYKNHSPESGQSQLGDEIDATSIARREPLVFLNGGWQRCEAPIALQNQSQVQFLNIEQQPKDYQLGYRFSDVNIAKNDTMIHESSLPMFDGTNPDCWIVKADRFFVHDEDEAKIDLVFLYLDEAPRRWFYGMMRRSRFRDWSEFKQSLLDRFGSVKISQPPEVNQKESCLVTVQQEEIKLKKDSLVVTDHEAKLTGEVEATVCVENTDLFLAQETIQSITLEQELVQTSCSPSPIQTDLFQSINPIEEPAFMSEPFSMTTSEGVFQPQQIEHSVFEHIHVAVSDKTFVLQSAVVHMMQSPVPEEIDEISAGVASSFRQTEVLANQNLLPEIVQEVETVQKKQIYALQDQFQSHSGLLLGKIYSDFDSDNLFFQQEEVFRFQQKRKLRLSPTSWRFKFKLRDHHETMSCSDHTLLDESVGRFPLKHKWRCKQLTQASLLALEEVAGNGTALQPFGSCYGADLIILIDSSLRASLFSRVEVYKRIITCWLILYELMWLLSTEGRTDVLDKYLRKEIEETDLIAQCLLQLFQQLTHAQLEKTEMNHILKTEMKVLLIHIQCASFTEYSRKFRTAYTAHELLTLHEFLTFKELDGIQRPWLCIAHETKTSLYHLWHRWKNKFKCLTGYDGEKRLIRVILRQRHNSVADRGTYLQLYRVCHESYSINFISSLRSSLFSRERVYKRTLIYWFRVNVLIWLLRETDPLKKDVKKQKERTKQKTHWMIQMLNKERGGLLLYSRRDLLQVLIQQKRKWKIWYKSLMFKYKQRVLEHLIKVSTKVDIPIHLYQTQPYMKKNAQKTTRYKSSLNTRLLLQLGCLQQVLVPLLLFYQVLKKLLVTIKGFNDQLPQYKLVGKLIFKGGCIDKLRQSTGADVDSDLRREESINRIVLHSLVSYAIYEL